MREEGNVETQSRNENGLGIGTSQTVPTRGLGAGNGHSSHVTDSGWENVTNHLSRGGTPHYTGMGSLVETVEHHSIVRNRSVERADPKADYTRGYGTKGERVLADFRDLGGERTPRDAGVARPLPLSAQDGNAESNSVVERSDGRHATHPHNVRDPHLTHIRQLLDFEPEAQGVEEPWNLMT